MAAKYLDKAIRFKADAEKMAQLMEEFSGNGVAVLHPRAQPLLREHDGRGSWRWKEFNRRETCVVQPGTIVRLAISEAALRSYQHLGREHHCERVPRAVVIDDEIVDDEGATRLDSLAALAKKSAVVGR